MPNRTDYSIRAPSGTKRSYVDRLPAREHVKAEGMRHHGVPFTLAVRRSLELAVRSQSGAERRLGRHRAVHVVRLPGIGRVRVVYSTGRHEVVDVLAP